MYSSLCEEGSWRVRERGGEKITFTQHARTKLSTGTSVSFPVVKKRVGKVGKIWRIMTFPSLPNTHDAKSRGELRGGWETNRK